MSACKEPQSEGQQTRGRMRGQPTPGPPLGSVEPCSDPVGTSPCLGTPGLQHVGHQSAGGGWAAPSTQALLPSRDEPRSTQGSPRLPLPFLWLLPSSSSPPHSLLPLPSAGTGKPGAKLRLHGFASSEIWSPDSTEHSLPERLGWGRGRDTQSYGRLHAQLSIQWMSSGGRGGAEPSAHPDSDRTGPLFEATGGKPVCWGGQRQGPRPGHALGASSLTEQDRRVYVLCTLRMP